MKINLKVIALVFLALSSFGQAKLSSKKFVLPAGVTSADYQSGILMAKLKPEFRNLASSNVSGRSAALPDVAIRPLSNPALIRQNKSARGPLAPSQYKIDLSLYVRLFISPGTDIEQRINDLYETGYFDIIEPEYAAKIDFVPNDLLTEQQYYLSLIKAFDAWDITQSDAGTVIGVVDSGGDLLHTDLAPNLYTNPDEIPNNHLDDDADGYIDNVRGWDFMGSDTLNLYKADSIGDNNPQLKQDDGSVGHGVWVAGCAAAATNNGIGIAGVGFKTKLLFTKHTADNQKNGSVYLGYAGILYVAQTLTADNVKRKIINCSWGSAFRSQIAQDLITHVTLDLGCLVVAAAGNGNTGAANYPSSYDQVLSVGATDKNDVRASFSNYGATVDVFAPGVSIFTTSFNSGYATLNGTSFSSPIAAGAAALVWAKNPTFTPVQVAEQLRVTADDIDAINSPNFAQKLGKGRINIFSALTLSVPSVRASKPTLLDNLGNTVELGKEGLLTLSFTNYLKTSGSLTLEASTTATGVVTFSKAQVSLGVINAGATVRNTNDPIKLVINATTPENSVVEIKLKLTDGIYSDFQLISLLVNPSYIDADENTITTSIASTGRIGYDDPSRQLLGSGFAAKDIPILFEMGLLMGTSSTNLFNNVRGVNNAFDQNFVKVSPIKKIVPGLRTKSEIFGSFSPSALPSLVISYRSLTMKEKPNDKFVIVEYTLINNSTLPITNFRFGLFADWDISNSGAKDAADWDVAHKIGYVYPKGSTTLPHAGIQALNSAAAVYSIDNDQKIINTPFGLYDGYTPEEKFTSLSTVRNKAGETSTGGNDVSHVVSVSPFTIPAGGQIVLAFALHAANNLTELLASADAANILYNQVFNIPKPSVTVSETCFGSGAMLTAGSGSTPITKFKWYKNFTGGKAFDSLSTTISTVNLVKDSTIYVSNADNTYESVRTPALIKLKANPTISSAATSFCPGESTTLSVATADSYLWSSGQTTQSIAISSAGSYSVTVKYNAKNCTSVSAPLTIGVLSKPTAAFATSGNLAAGVTINFTDLSTNAATYAWDFGDNLTSTAKNPSHQYATPQNYLVTLSVIGLNGCSDVLKKPLDVITGLEDGPLSSMLIYPNPVSEYFNIRMPNTFDHAALAMINLQGQMVLNTSLALDREGNQKISIGSLPEGIYLVRVHADNQSFSRKISVKH